MAYQREDMLYRDYYWAMLYEAGDPHICGEFNDTILRRTAGKEMLYFINRCTEVFRKLEMIVLNLVPKHLKVQSDVKQWIDDHADVLWNQQEVAEVV